MESKGQASFEIIILVAFIFTLGFILASYFFEESVPLSVEAKAKSVVLEEIQSAQNPEFYRINEISFDNASNTVNVCIGSENDLTQGFKERLSSRIIQAVSQLSVNVVVKRTPLLNGFCDFG